jgi:hypothetical protein
MSKKARVSVGHVATNQARIHQVSTPNVPSLVSAIHLVYEHP